MALVLQSGINITGLHRSLREPKEGPFVVKVLLVDANEERAAAVIAALEGDGCEVVWRRDLHRPERAVAEVSPEVVLIEQDSPTRDTLESMRRISESNPRPIAFFVDRTDRESMKNAIRAGVSAYVVHEVEAIRVRSILDVAIARFEAHQEEERERLALSDRLGRSEARWQERGRVERAKGILMKRFGFDEETAYARLREEAMRQRCSLGDVAKQVLEEMS